MENVTIKMLEELQALNLRLKSSIERMEEFHKLKAPEICIRGEINIQKKLHDEIQVRITALLCSEKIEEIVQLIAEEIGDEQLDK